MLPSGMRSSAWNGRKRHLRTCPTVVINTLGHHPFLLSPHLHRHFRSLPRHPRERGDPSHFSTRSYACGDVPWIAGSGPAMTDWGCRGPHNNRMRWGQSEARSCPLNTHPRHQRTWMSAFPPVILASSRHPCFLSSCPDLIRVSIAPFHPLMSLRPRALDCRVRPGNDGGEGLSHHHRWAVRPPVISALVRQPYRQCTLPSSSPGLTRGSIARSGRCLRWQTCASSAGQRWPLATQACGQEGNTG